MSDGQAGGRLVLVAAALFVGAMAVLYLFAVGGDDPPPAAVSAVAVAPRAADAAGAPAPVDRAPRLPPPSEAEEPEPEEADEPTPLPRIELEPETPSPDIATVGGQVRDSDGNILPHARVNVIAGKKRLRLRADAQGRFLAPNVPAGAFMAWAERRDGALSVRSPNVEIETFDGGEYEIELQIPAEVQGGLGINLRPHEDGAAVGSVLVGGHGEYLGLQKGDVIVEVNGQDLGGMNLQDISMLIKGPEGTSGTMVVQRAGTGREEEMTFEREFVEKVRRRPR